MNEKSPHDKTSAPRDVASPADHTPLFELARSLTPARLFAGTPAAAYSTQTQLELRLDHAAARDAVTAELHLADQGQKIIDRFQLFEVPSRATSRAEHLLRPDLGRKLAPVASRAIRDACPVQPDVQVVIGDGLSATAVLTQVPLLLPLIHAEAARRNWTLGRPFAIRYCRVGIMNDVGELLVPKVLILLIGERPGLATSESLSAYMAYAPRPGDTDADRNLISNIHARGVPVEEAALRIAALAEEMLRLQLSGVNLKERLADGAILNHLPHSPDSPA